MNHEAVDVHNLEERGIREDVITTCKILRGHNDVNVEQFFQVRRQSKTTEHDWKISQRSVRRDVLKYFFSNRAVDMWNKLL